MKLDFEIPLKLVKSQNSRGHWAKTARPRRREREAVKLAFPKDQVKPVLLVTLTRYGPNELDDDNLRATLKGVRDEVAHQLRINDGSRLVVWLYAQVLGEYSVRVSVASEGPMPQDPLWMDAAARVESQEIRKPRAQRGLKGRLTPATYRPGGTT